MTSRERRPEAAGVANRRRRPWALSVAGLLLAVAFACRPAEPEFDVLIRGALIVDGTGAPAYPGDVAVRGDRIVGVSSAPLPAGSARQVVEAGGLAVAPGFIDLHAHLEPLLEIPEAENLVRQGVTTALGGPDGFSPWPLEDHLRRVEDVGVGLNVAFLVGHNTVRREVMGLAARAPSPEELSRMREMVARAMEEGAWGLSTGLKYIPGAYSELEEIVALAQEAARRGGIYTSHLREEGLELIEGVEEAVEVGRRAGIPVVLTHHKVVGAPMWGASARTLALVEKAREEGIDVMLDQYPYTATHTGIDILIPAWAMEGGVEAFLQRLEDPLLLKRIKEEIAFNIVNDRGGNDLRRVQLARVEWDPELEGKSLFDWAVREGSEPDPETGAELVVEAMRRGRPTAIFHALHEEDVERILQHPLTMVASDGRLVRKGDGHPHPRWYGTFPRVLGVYVREKGLLGLEEGVRKMTSMPAERLGLEDRGTIREGAFADLLVFDPETVRDRSTFQDPHRYPEGIFHVFVNGVAVVRDESFQDLRPGLVLRASVPP